MYKCKNCDSMCISDTELCKTCGHYGFDPMINIDGVSSSAGEQLSDATTETTNVNENIEAQPIIDLSKPESAAEGQDEEHGKTLVHDHHGVLPDAYETTDEHLSTHMATEIVESIDTDNTNENIEAQPIIDLSKPEIEAKGQDEDMGVLLAERPVHDSKEPSARRYDKGTPSWIWASLFGMTVLAVVLGILYISAMSSSLGEISQADLVDMPNVVELPADEAQRQLLAAGFIVHMSESYSDLIPIGQIVAQIPPAGTIEYPTGSVVVLMISAGRHPVEIQNLRGFYLADVIEYLEAHSLHVEIEHEYNDHIPMGYVIGNLPGAYSEGEVVELLVSGGPWPRAAEELPTPTTPVPTSPPVVLIEILYNQNFTSGQGFSVTLQVGQDHVVLPNSTLREGFTFREWNTVPDGSGARMLPGSTLHELAEDITLYAIWQGAPVPVERILHVPSRGMVFTPLQLSGVIYPENAKTTTPISWGVFADGGTGATISGSTMTALSHGTVIVRAVVPSGISASPRIDFEEFFFIEISGLPPIILGPTAVRGTRGLGGTQRMNISGEAAQFFIGGQVPQGVQINNSGLLTWTSATPVGAHYFWIVATNQHGTSGQFMLNLIIE